MLGGSPGTTLGTYNVKGTLSSNTCGLGVSAPNPWEFQALLSQKGSTLYWNWLDASPLLSGPLEAGGKVTLTAFQVQNVDTADGGAMGPCDLERNDDLALTLGSGSPPGSFSGTVSYAFSVQEGSSCADQLAPVGMYTTLPCSFAYAVTATHD
jgi:hypothetical protein